MTTPLRAIIADDEAMARARLRRLLTRMPDVVLAGEAEHGDALRDLVHTTAYDVLLLDIEMPGAAVFDILRDLPSSVRLSIIFVTAYDRYAAQAFDVDAVDYLVKPVTRERLAEALDRVRRRHVTAAAGTEDLLKAIAALERRQRLLEESVQPARTTYLTRMLVRDRNAEHLVSLDDVEVFEADGNYVRVRTATRDYLVRGTLQSVEDTLNPLTFVRVHRGTIVNLEHMREVQGYFWGDGVIITRRGHRVRMSRRYRASFYSRFPGGDNANVQAPAEEPGGEDDHAGS